MTEDKNLLPKTANVEEILRLVDISHMEPSFRTRNTLRQLINEQAEVIEKFALK